MKKLIESRFGLAVTLTLVNLLTFLIPNFWGQIFVLFGIIMLQLILETKDDRLEWGYYYSLKRNSNEWINDLRNSLFSFTKWLTFVNFIYCGLLFNLEKNSLGLISGIVFLVLTLSLILFNYLYNSMHSRLRDWFMIPVLMGIIISVYLNFKTQFIWVPIILFFLANAGSVFNDLVYPLVKKSNKSLLAYVFIVLVIIGLVSTVIQFWLAITLFFTFSICGIPLLI
jgi:hypothetical protein